MEKPIICFGLDVHIPLQPCLDLGVLVRGVVVGDQVHVEMPWRFSVETARELSYSLVAMARYALADHPVGGHVERGERNGSAMALVVAPHGAVVAIPEWPVRLGAIERLDLSLLINREHQSLLGPIEIEPDNILHFLGKPLIVRQIDGLHQVWLQFVRFPDALHAGVVKAAGRGHFAAAPVCPGGRLLVQRLVHHLLDRRSRQRRLASLPAADLHFAFASGTSDRYRGDAFSRQQHYPRPPSQLLGRVLPRYPPFQRHPLRRR